MDFQLLEQLREAGFPQKIVGEGARGRYLFDDNVLNGVYEPTLSELIAAIGDLPLFIERRKDGKWAAGIKPTEHSTFLNWDAFGAKSPYGHLVWGDDSPEAAVAHLWLALNTKDV